MSDEPRGQHAVVASIELVGVPFDGYGRPGNQASAAAVLRAAGLADALALDGAQEVLDRGDLALPPPDPARGTATSLVNETALVAMTDAVERSVTAALRADRFPVVHGGDCTTLLGVVPALTATTGAAAVLFVDGHEDTMPLDVSEDGEAANTEIGLLLGLTGGLLRGPLAARRGTLPAAGLAVLGQRDDDWRRRHNVGALGDLGIHSRTVDQVATDPAGEAVTAVRHLQTHHRRWWLHVDLDVLDPREFPAQGIPGVPDEPGGLTRAQLEDLVTSALGAGGCAGWSVAIYDPDQDPSRAGARMVRDLATRVAAAL